MKKTIAVIGAAGNMGSGLARNLAAAGYRVLLAGEDQSKLEDLLGAITKSSPRADVAVIDCSKNASWEADVIIPAVPYQAQADVASKIKDVVAGKIVVSIVNPLNDTYDGLLTGPTTSAAEELAALLPYSKVVKAFNTVFAADFKTPKIAGQIADAFVAGDDAEAAAVVAELVKDAGFNPLMAGKLSMSRTLENMTVLMIGLNLRNKYNWLAGWKILHETTSNH